jgi:hypothetical protein
VVRNGLIQIVALRCKLSRSGAPHLTPLYFQPSWANCPCRTSRLLSCPPASSKGPPASSKGFRSKHCQSYEIPLRTRLSEMNGSSVGATAPWQHQSSLSAADLQPISNTDAVALQFRDSFLAQRNTADCATKQLPCCLPSNPECVELIHPGGRDGIE